MSKIGQATTPTLVCTVPDTVDLTAAEHVYLTLCQDGRRIKKTGEALTVGAHSVSVWLNQRDTVWLTAARPVEVQLNWTYADGSRGMTKIASVLVDRNLVPEVLE